MPETIIIERPPVLNPNTDSTPTTPKNYGVLLHNDDTTPFDFVVQVLQKVFNLNGDEAYNVMWKVHTNNAPGLVRMYPLDIAETKAAEAIAMAKASDWGLLFTVEEVE